MVGNPTAFNTAHKVVQPVSTASHADVDSPTWKLFVEFQYRLKIGMVAKQDCVRWQAWLYSDWDTLQVIHLVHLRFWELVHHIRLKTHPDQDIESRELTAFLRLL